MGTQPTHELACQPLVSEIVLVHCFALETQQEVAFLHLASQFDLLLRRQQRQLTNLSKVKALRGR